MTLEVGQVSPPQWFDARNIGSHTWYSSGQTVTHLGTASPHDDLSSFYDSASWKTKNRVTVIGQPSVAVGQTGRFNFQVRAPQTPGTFDEHFAPVADGPGGGWMDGQAQWSNVFLTYYVRAATAPTIKEFSVSPRLVRPGEPVSVAVQATDNVAVDRVSVSLGGRESTLQVPYAPPYNTADRFAATTQLDTGGLGAGEHTVIVQAVDKVGQADVVGSEIVVRAASAQDPPAGKRRSGRVGPYVASFGWHAKNHDAPRVVEKITLLPAPRNATGTVFCRRGCSLPYSSKKSSSGRVVFKDGVLATGMLVPPGALIETRLMKDGVGRYRIYDAELGARSGGCLARRDGALRRVRCGG